jgi:hypothetical protein
MLIASDREERTSLLLGQERGGREGVSMLASRRSLGIPPSFLRSHRVLLTRESK